MITITVSGGDAAIRKRIAEQVYELMANSRFVVKKFPLDRGTSETLADVDLVLLERTENPAS